MRVLGGQGEVVNLPVCYSDQADVCHVSFVRSEACWTICQLALVWKGGQLTTPLNVSCGALRRYFLQCQLASGCNGIYRPKAVFGKHCCHAQYT